MSDYERILLVKSDVNVYRIPPRSTNRAYRASDWNLDAPDWLCRLRLVSKNNVCFIKLDEKSTGQFFGQCPIDKHPGPAVETVSDSSRYFVLRLINEQTNRTAYVGIGFADRSDSFDFNVALQDFFKIVQMEESSNNETEDNLPKLDLGFKEGQTIKVNLNLGKKTSSKLRPKGSSSIGGILLPPPPGSTKTSVASSTQPSSNSSHSVLDQNLFEGVQSLSLSETNNEPTSSTETSAKIDKLLSLVSGDNGENEVHKSKLDDSWSCFETVSKKEEGNKIESTFSDKTKDNWASFD